MKKIIFGILLLITNNALSMQQPARVYDQEKTNELEQILNTCFNCNIFYSNILDDEEEKKINELILGGADPNVIASGSFYQEHTLLEALAANEKNYGYHPRLFMFLLKNGANPNRLRSVYQHSPLINACNADCLGATILLVAHGANVNHINLLNETCLFDAVRKYSAHIVQFLLENGAAPCIQIANNDNETPLTFVHKSDYATHYTNERNRIRELLELYRKQII